MAEFNTGMSEVRKFTRTLELISKAMKNLIENGKDVKEYKSFINELKQSDPKNPVMNDSNTAFYDVTGVGPQKMEELLKANNIPCAAFIDQKTGTTVIAVPKQHDFKANLLLAKSNELSISSLKSVAPTQGNLTKLTANMVHTPSPLVLASMRGGTAVTKTFDSARWMPLAQQMEAANIPFAVVKDSKAGTTTLIFDQTFALQAQTMDLAIEKAQRPAELGYADFMRNNLGQPIVERAGLTEGQMREFRQELRGSCAEYNVQKMQNGTYTVRYHAAQARYLEPAMTSVLVRSNGVNRQGEPMKPALDAHAHYVSVQAEQAHGLAQNKQQMVIADAATHTDRAGFEQRYVVNDKGLVGPDGKLIVSKDDPKFAETVHSVTSQMKSPVVKAVGPDGKVDDGIFSRAEIVAAKESYAAAVPSDATIVAAQVATLKVSTELSRPNANLGQALNNSANFCQNIANSIEEENFRLDPEELSEEPRLYGPEKPDKVVEFEDTVHKLQPAEKANLSEGLRRTTNDLAGYNVRAVSKNDLAIEEMGRAMDREDMGHEDMGREDMGRSDDTPALDDGPILEGV